MATGYIVSGRGDLDTLFKARTSTASADTGFKNSGGVDLAQLFEPRGVSTAIADTGFKSAGTDLASVFMDIAAAAGLMGIGAATLSTSVGFYDGYGGGTAYGFASGGTGFGGAGTISTARCYQVADSASIGAILIGLAGVTAVPTDADTTWQSLAVVGVFTDSAGASVTRTLTRSARTTTTLNGPLGRIWQFPRSSLQLISGNAYALTFTHT